MGWKSYFFTADFSDVKAFFADKQEGFIFQGDDATTLAAIFQQHDRRRTRTEWHASTQTGDYNLMGAVIEYHGESNPNMPINSRYNRVIQLRLNSQGGTVPNDVLYLQYHEVT